MSPTTCIPLKILREPSRPGSAFSCSASMAAICSSWKLHGARGVITSNTCRDTDEIIAEKVPLYLRQVDRGIRRGCLWRGRDF